MTNKTTRITLFCSLTLLGLISCDSETETEKFARLEREEQIKLDQEFQKILQQEEKRRKHAIWNEYSENSLSRGAKPWSNCFGRSNACNGRCSEIKINSPSNIDVVVLLKQGNVTKRHAYIPAGRSYTFNIPNGRWQPFFYYGKGWYPDKEMESSSCSSIKGGFLENEDWDKDSPDYLEDVVLTYTLTSVVNGNFQTQSSSQSEAL